MKNAVVVVVLVLVVVAGVRWIGGGSSRSERREVMMQVVESRNSSLGWMAGVTEQSSSDEAIALLRRMKDSFHDHHKLLRSANTAVLPGSVRVKFSQYQESIDRAEERTEALLTELGKSQVSIAFTQLFNSAYHKQLLDSFKHATAEVDERWRELLASGHEQKLWTIKDEKVYF